MKLSLKLGQAAGRLVGGPSALAVGSFFSVAGGGIAKVLMLALSIVLARLLGQTRFGAYGAVLSTVMLFQTLSGYGLSLTATRYVAKYRRSSPDRTGGLILLMLSGSSIIGLLSAVAMFFMAEWVSCSVYGTPSLALAFRIASIAVLLGGIKQVMVGVLIGMEAFRQVAIINALTASSCVVFILSGAWLSGLEGAVAGLCAGTAIAAAVTGWMLLRGAKRMEISFRGTSWMREGGVLYRFSLPSLLSTLLVIPVNWVCTVILAKHPGGFNEVAILTVAMQWRAAILFVPALVGQVALPLMTNRPLAESRSVLRTLRLFNIAVGLLVTLFIAGSGKLILAGYGHSFTKAWGAFMIFQVGTLLQLLQAHRIKDLEASGRMWLNLLLNVGWATILVGSAVAMAADGAMGVALAQVGAFTLFGLALVLFVRPQGSAGKKSDQRCEICDAPVTLFEGAQPGYVAGTSFTIVHCTGCRAAHALPMESDHDVYEAIYADPGAVPGYSRYAVYHEQVLKESQPLAFLADSEESYWAVPRFLSGLGHTDCIADVGSGLGYLTYALRREGHHAVGVEISSKAAEAATSKYGDFFFTGTVLDAQQEYGAFDAAVMIEAIEHITDPASMIQSVLAAIKEGGSLLLTTPNRSFYKDNVLWETDPPPVHLWWFTEESMRELATSLSCDIAFIDFTDYYAGHPKRERRELGSGSPTRVSILGSDMRMAVESKHIVLRIGRWLRRRSLAAGRVLTGIAYDRRVTSQGPVMGVILKKRA